MAVATSNVNSQPNLLQKIGSSIYRQETSTSGGDTTKTTTILGGFITSSSTNPTSTSTNPQQGTASSGSASTTYLQNRDAACRIKTYIPDTIFNTAQSLANTTGNLNTDTANFASSFQPALNSLSQAFGNAGGAIAGVNTSVNQFYANTLNSVRKQTKGYSDHLGAIVGGLDGIVRDPLNPKNLSNMATSILNRVSPGSAGKINQSIQNLHLDKLAKAPALLLSSVQKLASTIDNILSIPVAFISQIYFGVIGLIKQIGKLLNNLIQGFQQFIFDFLDAALGGQLKQIMQLLDDIGTLAGQIQGIASIFGGANIVSGFALQINNFTTQINSALANPLDTALSYLPTDITKGYSQIMYNLQNPENIINKLLPPELSQIFAKISQITGYGFNGNMGYSFASVLQGMQGGVINGILTNFAAQYKILGPLLGGTNYEPPLSYIPSTDNGFIQGKRYGWNPNTNLYEVK